MTLISAGSPSAPMCCAQGRHGELIIAQKGARPLRWNGEGNAVQAGMEPPPSKPVISIDATPNYHIARIDVSKPGAVYNSAPSVRLTGGDLRPAKGVACKARAYLSQAALSEVIVDKGGKYYGVPPTATLGLTQEEIDAGGTPPHGHGAVIKAELDKFDKILKEGDDAETGITGYELISDGPPWSEEEGFLTTEKVPYGIYKWVDVPLENGEHEIAGPRFFYGSCFAQATVTVRISGITSGSGAKVRIYGTGWEWGGCETVGFATNSSYNLSTGIGQLEPLDYGSGYSQDDEITIRVIGIFKINPQGTPYRQRPAPPQYDAVIKAYIGGDPKNPLATGHGIRSLTIEDGGKGYIVAPQIQIISSSGFGAYATCTVKDGAIDTVTLENPGGGYKVAPECRVLSGGAEAAVVARPHLRGLYQCYYRHIDDTPENLGGPIPSNLSDVTEVDAGEHATSITWSIQALDGRAKKVELWRTTGNQALTLYRVATVEGPSTYLDDLTDEELRDPDRDGYEAMPIVLPNGELNAQRFTPPPSSSVVVMFQDRFWYGVGLPNPNAIYFSEIDEPESVPEVNEIIPMQSGKGSDSLTALIPFGTTLLLMQSRHCYGLTFSRQPLLDAQVSPIAYRGCVNQRCWDMHDGVLYVMDQYGVYAITEAGAVSSISDQIEDQFRSKVLWSSSDWNFLTVDPKTKTLRAFVCHADDGSAGWPTRALCYSIDSKGWWHESYPQRITGSSQSTLSNGEYRCVYSGQSGPVLLDEGAVDIARGTVTAVQLVDGGAGYRVPPTVTAPSGTGAKFQATLDGSGRVKAIWILNGGSGYSSGSLSISAPDDGSHPSPVQAAATFTASSLSADESVSPLCRYKSGLLKYAIDDDDARIGGVVDRSIAVTYKPLSSSSDVSLRTYYNGSASPRGNAAARDRGDGVRYDAVDPAARLNIGESMGKYGVDAGQAKAQFDGNTSGDMRGTDRHVSVEIVGPRRTSNPLIIYEVDVMGG